MKSFKITEKIKIENTYEYNEKENNIQEMIKQATQGYEIIDEDKSKKSYKALVYDHELQVYKVITIEQEE
jgi:hypothetical protein